MMKLKKLSLGLALGAIFCNAASAQVSTWSGATDGNWSTATNWVGDVAPVAGNSLVFTGSANATAVNDFPANTSFSGIVFASGASSNFTLSGSAINLSGTIGSNRTSTPSNTAVALNNALALQSDVTIAVPNAGGTFHLGGQITGAHKLTKTGSGVAVFNNASNNFSGGLDVLGGIARFSLGGNSMALAGTGAVTLNGGDMEFRSTGGSTFNNALVVGSSGGSLRGRSYNFNPASISGTGTLTLAVDSTQTLTPLNFRDWNGTVNVTAASFRLGTAYVNSSGRNIALNLNSGVTLTRQNGTNQVGLNPALPGAAPTTEFGSLSGAAGSTLGNSAAGNGFFIYQVGSLNTNTVFAGNIVNGGSRTALRKIGTGSLTLSGTGNTFSGTSQVNGGSLIVDGVLSNADLSLSVNDGGTLIVGSSGSIAGQVNVNVGGRLGGSGTITGAVNVTGGTIAPGTSPGTLTIDDVLVLDSSSILEFELNGLNTTIGGGINDLITSVTDLTLDGTLNISETSLNSFASAADGSTWRLINYTGTLTDNGLTLGSFPTLPSGGSLAIDTSTFGQVNLILTATAVPEPSSVALLGITFGLVRLARRHRSRKAQIGSVHQSDSIC